MTSCVVIVEGSTTLESSLRNAYAEYLFHRFSINDRDAKAKGFVLHDFARSGAIVAVGNYDQTVLCIRLHTLDYFEFSAEDKALGRAIRSQLFFRHD